MPDFTQIRYEVVENIATITLNRPDKANAMNVAGLMLPLGYDTLLLALKLAAAAVSVVPIFLTWAMSVSTNDTRSFQVMANCVGTLPEAMCSATSSISSVWRE